MTRFVVEPLGVNPYAVRVHEGDDPSFRTSCVIEDHGERLIVKLMHGPITNLPAWTAAAAEHFPQARWLRFWRKQPDGSLKQFDRRLR